MASIMYSLAFLSILLEITNYSSDSGKKRWPVPKISLCSPRVRDDANLLSPAQQCQIYTKGDKRTIKTYFRKTIFISSPRYLRPPNLKKYFSVAWDWANFLIFWFWDPFSSFIPVFQSNMLDIKPNQLPSTLRSGGPSDRNAAVCCAKYQKPPTIERSYYLSMRIYWEYAFLNTKKHFYLAL